MDVFFYAPVLDSAGKRLLEVIERLVPKEKLNLYQTIGAFFRRLCQPKDEPSIAVLLAATKHDLSDILTIGNLLENLRVILILPDSDIDTIAQGHILLPRVLETIDSDFAITSAVLDKMLAKYNINDNSTNFTKN